MKNILLIIAVISAPLSAQNMLEVLADGPLEKKTEAMLHMGYAGNKSGFWYYVKYLNYSQKENDSHDIVMARCAAAEALGRIKDDRAIKYLTERFSVEKNDTVRRKYCLLCRSISLRISFLFCLLLLIPKMRM